MSAGLIRILVDGYIFSSYPHGGIARFYREILSRIVVSNSDIDFYVMCDERSQRNLPSHRQIHPLTFRPLGFRPSRVFRHLDNWRLRKFKQSVADLKPHVFQSTYYTLPPFAGMKTVATVYDLIDHQFPLMRPNGFGFVKRQCAILTAADRVISISRSTTESTINGFGIDPAKIETVSLGVSDIFTPSSDETIRLFKADFTNGKPYFLFVGSTGSYKNLATVVRAFAKIAIQTGHFLLLAGHSMEHIEPWIIDLAIQSGVEEKIIVLHHPSDELLSIAYSAASAFIFPSLQEGFGIPLLEAMKCDCQVIASDIPVFREICEDAAVYFDPHSASELATAMVSVLSSDDEERSRRERKLRLSHFSWDVAAKKIANIYRELARDNA